MRFKDLFSSQQDYLDQLRYNWRTTIEHEGGRCPCCERWGKINAHGFIETMALSLLWISKQSVNDHGYVNVKKAPAWMVKGKYSLLSHWGLAVKSENKDDKTKGSGLWQITPKGQQFLRNQITIPRKVFIYDSVVEGFSTDEIFFRDCFGKQFDYQTVMADSFNLNTIKA
jgi:hypothetical protein